MRANKRETIIGISAFVVALLLVGAGLWWHGRSKPTQLSREGGTTSNAQISLDQGSPNEDSGGLSVNGQASDLGQLGTGQNGQQQQGQSGGTGGSSGSGGIDPSKFTQYDKYKNNKSALFADLKKGSGATLTAGKQANVIYKGWLTNGALIDQSPVSSSGQPQPFNFKMGAHQVIVGWEEGLYGMKAGGVRLVIVPPSVGYGSQAHGSVPADSTLVFEVQLLSVK